MFLQKFLYKSSLIRQLNNSVVSASCGMPEIVKLWEGRFAEHITTASEYLNSGGVIALPTDTLYGLAALTQNGSAVQEIYRIKQRNTLKPLAVCVAKIEDIYKWAKVTVPRKLLCDLLPGPVTLIFKRSTALNRALNPDSDLVGIRIPDSKFIRLVTEKCHSPLALTSANISNQTSPLEIDEFKDIWSELSCVYNGGHICEDLKIVEANSADDESSGACGSLVDSKHIREGSTIVNLAKKGFYSIVREGVALQQTTVILRDYGIKELL